MRLLRAVVAFLAAGTALAAESFLYIGTYTGPSSKGIYVASFDERTGKVRGLRLAAATANPSYIAIHPNHKFLYAVDETSAGTVSAFAIRADTGQLTFLNKVSSKGDSPCHISVDPEGKNLLVANYGSGSFAVLPIGADGKLHEASAFVQDTGKGPNAQRQEGPHAHFIQVSPDKAFAVGADLGVDKVFVFRFDAKAGSLKPNDTPFAAIKAGSGPRHLAFHPSGKFAYLTNELASTVTAFSWNRESGALQELQTISTLPAGFKGENTTAEIAVHPSGRFLYDSNRGDDSIAVFAIDQAKGTLTAVDRTLAGGKVPRNFELDPSGSFLIAANQKSDDLVVFRVDKQTGKLTSTGQIAHVGSPVCLKFLR
ncbi:MAG TPA: lactonase family protein [Bryobacteraceae bacterium]|nr:lactonase family protein [Bryobacteraceae bacterium]